MTNGSTVIESSDGVRVALHDLGGEGTPLLICHATGFHGRAYQPLADRLGAAFHVWALDFRGHGESTSPSSGNFAWRGMCDDLLASIDHLGGEPIRTVGHSMGGAAVLLAQMQRPGTITACYLFEPIVFARDFVPSPEGNPMSGPARRRRAEFDSRQAALERYGSRPPLSELHPDALAAYVEYGFVDTDEGTVRLACEPEHEARTFEAEDKMTMDRIDGLELDAVIAYGRSLPDRPSPADPAPEIAECLVGGRPEHHADLGHFGPLEDPDRIADRIVTALA